MIKSVVRIGLDLGSRRTKIVKLEDESIIDIRIYNSWPLSKKEVVEYIRCCNELYKQIQVGATGYYRYKAQDELGARVITEITAFARGVTNYLGDTRLIVDIGGQDAKVIALNDANEVENFEMNDKCAAGTGKFFELVAATLNLSLDAMIDIAYNSHEIATISSTCAVFAESEIISKLSENCTVNAIVRGVFRSVAERVAAMIRKINISNKELNYLLLVGGGANKALAKELEEVLGLKVITHELGSFFGAIGAATIDRSII